MPKVKKQQQKLIFSPEPRWFIWTIAFLIAVGMTLTGAIMIEREKESAQAYDSALITHNPKR